MKNRTLEYGLFLRKGFFFLFWEYLLGLNVEMRMVCVLSVKSG